MLFVINNFNTFTFIILNLQTFSFQGFAFLGRYLKMKGDNQETFYNIGRALHQLGTYFYGIF